LSAQRTARPSKPYKAFQKEFILFAFIISCEIAASIHDRYSIGPSIRPIYTRYCFTTISLIQVCSNFHPSRVCILHTRPDEDCNKLSQSDLQQSTTVEARVCPRDSGNSVGCRVQGVGCRVQGVGCRVQGAGCWE
jgi:hypothetical protein